jgi:glutathione synthase
MNLLFVIDPPDSIQPQTDTTLTFIEEALRRGHRVEVCEPKALQLTGSEVWADAVVVTSVDRELRPVVRLGSLQAHPLSSYTAVLMRKDPPFDLEYYFTTLLLERARGQTLLVNDPRGLREANEKLYILKFPSLIADTWVTRSIVTLKQHLTELGGEMIVKPLDGCGGAGVFLIRVEDRNTNAILEAATDHGRRLVMAQRYLPAARQGDKRILLLDGEPIGAVMRVPRADEIRGNLHVGGRAEKARLNARDLEICAEVGARCRQDGLYFVGLDVIGDHLTEVNVTSPTGVQEIDRLDGVRLEARFIDWLEQRAQSI